MGTLTEIVAIERRCVESARRGVKWLLERQGPLGSRSISYTSYNCFRRLSSTNLAALCANLIRTIALESESIFTTRAFLCAAPLACRGQAQLLDAPQGSVLGCKDAGGLTGLWAGSPALRTGSHSAERGWVWFRRLWGTVKLVVC